MASLTGSLETSVNSHSTNFSFPKQFMTSLLSDLTRDDESAKQGFLNHSSDQNEFGLIPKFKSISPPSLSISPSSSSFFAFPPGFNPSDFLDSPVLLSPSFLLPSPTTGAFPTQGLNWMSNSDNYKQEIKQENKKFTDFSFQPQTSTISKEESLPKQSLPWVLKEQSTEKSSIVKYEYPPLQSSPSETESTSTIKPKFYGELGSDYKHYPQPVKSLRELKRSEDGYNWRKYGQKQVKGTENPRSYYKCTYPNCPTKKKVERSLDGKITHLVYKPNKDSHNHPIPQPSRKSSASSAQSIQSSISPNLEVSNHFETSQIESASTQDNISSISIEDDNDFDHSSKRCKSGCDEFDENEPKSKKWKKEGENEGVSGYGNSRTVKEPKVVVRTTSDIDILDDGYRWRKYGQKVVKGNPNPRNYYKCTSMGCPVRKHVERASNDLQSVITTYEGKHNHDIPIARGSSYKPSSDNNKNNNIVMATRVSTSNERQTMTDIEQVPYTLEMVKNSWNFELPIF